MVAEYINVATVCLQVGKFGLAERFYARSVKVWYKVKDVAEIGNLKPPKIVTANNLHIIDLLREV